MEKISGHLSIGQRISCGWYGGIIDGIVFAVDGEQSNAILKIVFLGKNARISCVPEAILRGGQWSISDQIASKEEIESALKFVDEEIIRKKQEKEEADRYRAEQKKALMVQFSWLIPVDGQYYVDSKYVAKNIRIELKREFPGIKFSVSKNGYSPVNVVWTGGPSLDFVEKVTVKYRHGNAKLAFNELFGGCEYVFCYRIAICPACGQSKKIN